MIRITSSFAIFALASASVAQQTLLPTQDTFVESSAPLANFGSSRGAAAGKGHFWGQGFARLLVQFDLGGLSSGAEVGSATLRIYQYATELAAGGLTNDAYALLDPWDEMTVTWDSAPRRGAAAGDPNDLVGDSFHIDWIEFDVTMLVRAIADGAPNNGFMVGLQTEILAGASRYGYFHTREYPFDPALRPQLVIEPAAVCYADCDGSKMLDFFDLLCFQSAFALKDPYADCDESGALDFFDFLCFQKEFGVGCP